MDARLPPPRPGDDCSRTVLRGTDRRPRVNVDTVVDTFEPSGADAESDPPNPGPSRKRKRAEEGIRWSQVEYTVTLGVRPRDFIIQLASYCWTVDIQQAVLEVTSTHLSSTDTGTLASLTADHTFYGQNNNMTKFWQSVIEIQIALRCERFV